MAPQPKSGGKSAKKAEKSAKGRGKPKQDKINKDDIEEEYGLSWALFESAPELKKLLKKAVAGNWTPSKFQVELRQSDWFKKHSDVWRENTALSYSDPATFQERLDNTVTKLGNLAAASGASLSEGALQRLAKRALLFGMDDAQLRDHLAAYVVPSAEGNYTGDLSAVENELRQTAMQNGVKINDDQLKKWMRSIVRGDASQDQFVTNIRSLAAQQFPLYGEQIKGGMDLMDVATPYLQSMASMLELPATGLTLEDPTIRRALAGARDNKGAFVPTSIADFEDTLRKDSRWMYTRSAKDQAKGYAANIAKMWGLS